MTDREPEEPLMLTLDMLELAWPERFWMATRADLPWLKDPDATEGQRHADRDTIRWAVLGTILTEVSAALATGGYAVSTDVSDTIEIPLQTTPSDGLTRSEMEIIEEWWDHGIAPRADLWAGNFLNGRHRLWNVWKHDPTAVLPIRSEFLDVAAELPDIRDEKRASVHAASIREQASLAHEAFTTEFAQRSPLYVDAIDKARSLTAP
jgi:hypothetical protein